MRALHAARQLGLQNWCIAAGAVRNPVWDRLFGCTSPTADVDLVYFDATDTDPQRDRALQAELRAMAPEWDWEVVNQAGVHHWYEASYGGVLPPYRSLDDALARWPETATAVGLRLEPDDRLTVLAPLGLQDLFDGVLRHNPAGGSVAQFQQRLVDKRFLQRWPGLRMPRDGAAQGCR
ncbi:nucleotidyltransferase family protein [Inhella sp. 1Y17]|uniref:Nucleotidyltransferase family protein n=2 Tax=Inhella proteolytica TaxID=2795029 RepID=A0A931J313_9BURK|nr:nucleotidyltransferase family protein [Inhella proteolytica]